MKRVMEKALRLRDNINTQTGYNDTNITNGVKRLLKGYEMQPSGSMALIPVSIIDTHNVTRIPQTQEIPLQNNNDCETEFESKLAYLTLDYLESTGFQYIDTGFKPTPNTRIVIDMEFTSTSTSTDGQIMGCGYNNIAANSGRFSFFFGLEHPTHATNPNEFYTNIIDSSNYAWHYLGIGGLERHVWDLQNGSQKIDNVEYGTQSISSDKTSALNLYLFARLCSWDSGRNYCKVRIYSCKIYDNDILVRDFVPRMRTSDGVYGLLDILTNTLYTNVGSGTFITGPIITGTEQETEYIEADGKQYINTGLTPNSFDTFEGDIEFSEDLVGSALFGVSSVNDASSTNGKTAILIENQRRLYPNIGINGNWYSNEPFRFQKNVRYHIEIVIKSGMQKLIVDGTEIVSATKSANTNTNNFLYLFAINYNNATPLTDYTDGTSERRFKGKLYNCTFSLNNNIVRNYISVFSSLYGACLMDTINNRLHINIGSGSFTPGPIISGGE